MNISDRKSIEQWEALNSISTFFGSDYHYDDDDLIESIDCSWDSNQVLTRTLYDADTFILDGEMLEAWVDELFKMPGYPELMSSGFTSLVIIYRSKNDLVSLNLAKALFHLNITLSDVYVLDWESESLFKLLNSKCSYAISIESLLDATSGKFLDGEIEYTYDLFKALGEIK